MYTHCCSHPYLPLSRCHKVTDWSLSTRRVLSEDSLDSVTAERPDGGYSYTLFPSLLTVCAGREAERERDEESCDPIKDISCLLYGHC